MPDREKNISLDIDWDLTYVKTSFPDELNLVAAVLTRSIGDLNPKLCRLMASPADRADALRWVTYTGNEPWSFNWCCEQLGIKPDRILKRIWDMQRM